jgi:hypothetical protein
LGKFERGRDLKNLNQELKSQAIETIGLLAEDKARIHDVKVDIVYNALRKATIDGMKIVLEAYGNYTKVSPAYDRMRAEIVEATELT